MIFLLCPNHGETYGEPNIIDLVADGVRIIIVEYRKSFPSIMEPNCILSCSKYLLEHSDCLKQKLK